MSRRALIVAQPRDPATAMPVTIRLGGGGLRPLYHGGQHYRAGVVGTPRYAAALGFGEGGWTGASVPTTGQILFKPAQRSLLDQLATYYWRGAAVAISAGPEDGAIVPELTGEIASAAVTQGALNLTISDLTFGLSKPLIVARFLGTGGIEGVAEAAGRVKRRNFGRVFDIEGRILDKANSIYEFGDPSYPCLGILKLRDKGREGPTTIVGWQGSIDATLAALIATVAPSGGGVVAPSICCAKWWTQPAGPLCADIQGEIGAGYADSAPGIAARVLSVAGGPAIGNLTAAIALRPAPAGLHVGDVNESVAQALDRLLLGVSLAWDQAPDGSIDLREIAFGVAVETIRSIDVTRGEQFPPQRARRVGYQRNERQHNDGEISLAVDGAKLLRIITNRVTIYCNADGTPKAGQNVAMRAELQNSTAAITWQLKDEVGADRTTYLTIVDDEAFLTPANFDAARGAGLSVTVFVSAADGGVVVSDELTIGRTLDGQDAAAGVNQFANSHFRLDGQNWGLAYAGVANNGTVGWANGALVLASNAPDPGPGAPVVVSFGARDGSALLDGRHVFRVFPGQRVAVRMAGDFSRAAAHLQAYFRFFGNPVGRGNELAGGGLATAFPGYARDLEFGVTEAAVFVDVPPGTFGMEVEFYVNSISSAAAVSLAVKALMLASIAPDQTMPPVWNEGPTAAYRADVTGENTAADTYNVGGVPAAQLVTTISNIVADGVLSRGEKPGVYTQYVALNSNWGALDAKASALGVASAERSAASSAMGALYSNLMALAPSWTDANYDTSINAASWQSWWSNAYWAVAALQAAIQGIPGQDGRSVDLSSSTLNFAADYTGAVKSGQLPRTTRARYLVGSNDRSGSASWSLNPAPAGCAASIDASGLVTVTDVTANGVITIRGEYGGVPIVRYVDTVVQKDPAPPSTATSQAVTGWTISGNSVYPTVPGTGIVTVMSNGAGQIALKVSLTFATAQNGTTNNSFLRLKAIYRVAGSGSGWSDLATAGFTGSAATYSYNSGEPITNLGLAKLETTAGGLSANTAYEVAFVGRNEGFSAATGVFGSGVIGS